MKNINFVIVVEPGIQEWQALICLASIKKFCLDDYQIYCYTQKSMMDELKPITLSYFTDNNIIHHTIEENNLQEYPHTDKIIALQQKRDPADFCIYLDSGVIFTKEVNLTQGLCKKEKISVVAADYPLWKDDDSHWEALYKSFDLPVPEDHIIFGNGKHSLPYFNTGMICLPENSNLSTQWFNAAKHILENKDIDYNKSILNQIAFSITVAQSDFQVHVVKNIWNYSANNEKEINVNAKIIRYKDLKWAHYHKLNATLINPLIQEHLNLQNLMELRKVILNTVSSDEVEEKLIGKYKKITKTQDKPILFLHMGVHRTGTTTVQDILAYNRKRLKDQEFLYPKIGDRSSGSSLAWDLFKGKVNADSLLEMLQEENMSDEDSVILSDEDFCQMPNNKWLKSLKSKFDLRIIIYLRRQDLWIDSWYNQHIRWPWNKKFSNSTADFFVDNLDDFHWIDYSSLLSKIEEAVGRSNMHVEVVDTLGTKDTTSDMLEHIGIECISRKDILRSNASISALKLDILRRIDLMSFGDNNKAKMRVLSAIKNIDIKGDDGKKSALTPEQSSFILDRFSDSNKLVAREYFDREELFSTPTITNKIQHHLSEDEANYYVMQLLKEIASL